MLTVKDIYHAIFDKRLIPYVQPLYHPVTNRCLGCEVLSRIIDNNGKIILPRNFIDSVETSNLLIPFTCELLEELSFFFKSTSCKIDNTFYVSFNITAKKLTSTEIYNACRCFVKNTPSKIRLVLEVTERSEISFNIVEMQRINNLKNIVVDIWLDDFGEKYSNESALKERFFNGIKVSAYIANSPLFEIIERYYKETNCNVIIEGIENERQALQFKNNNISLLQGYYYGKPMNLERFKLVLFNNYK